MSSGTAETRAGGSATVVVATGNPGKLTELRALLADTGMSLVPQVELGIEPAAETGTSFVANALLKARHAARAAGLPAIADDSGLEVAALDGGPGVHSARYAGPGASDAQNIDKLLQELAGTRGQGRDARFVCAAVYVEPGDASPPLVASGEWRGRILEARRGDEGFGYDPVFYDPRLGLAAAELDSAAKNRLSHRGRAMRELVRLLLTRRGSA